MSKYVVPTIKERSFNCPVCGVYTQHFWYEALMANNNAEGKNYIPVVITTDILNAHAKKITTAHEIEKKTDDSVRRYNTKMTLIKKHLESISKSSPPLQGKETSVYNAIDVGNVFFSLCHHCDQASIWFCENLLYPVVNHEIPVSDDMPNEARKDFEEARKIVKDSPRGAAALLRVCIEKLCQSLKCTGSLNDMIGQLVEKGLSKKIQQALDTVRVIGNEAVHPGTMDIRDNQETALSLFRLVNIIVEQMITEEKRIAEVFSGLPEDKLAAIKKRDSKA